MARKKKDTWVIEDWDDSLDSKDQEKRDPFSFFPSSSEDEDWGMSLGTTDHKNDSSQQKSPVRIIIIVCGILIIFSLVVIGIIHICNIRKKTPTDSVNNTDSPSAVQTTDSLPEASTSSASEDEASSSSVSPVTETSETDAFSPTIITTRIPCPNPGAFTVCTYDPSTTSPAPAPTADAISSALDLIEWYSIDYRYYYHQLTDREKALYDALYDGIVHFKKSISISCTDSELEKVLDVLDFDAPELFQSSGGGRHWTMGTVICQFDPDYRMDQDTYIQICSYIHGIINDLKTMILPGADDYTKEYIINTYVVDHCTYLAAGDDSTALADACLYYRQSQCSGYARALSLLLRSFGIQCLNVHSSDHEWNIACINGNWYHVDSTWNDGEKEYREGGNRYFCWLNVPDRLASLDPDHHIEYHPSFTVPVCSSLQDNYAVREGLVINEGIDNPARYITEELVKAHRAGKNSVIILVDDFSTVTNWEDVFSRIDTGFNVSMYPPRANDCNCAFAVIK